MVKARLALCCFLWALPGLALGQASREALEDARRTSASSRAAAEAAAREAEAAAAEERGLAQQRVAMAARVQQAERILIQAEARRQAADAVAAQAFRLAADKTANLAPMMPAMRRLALWPAETLLAVPAPPAESLRGLLVLQSLARQIRAEAEEMRQANANAERQARIAATEAALVAAAQRDWQRAAEALDEEIAATRARESEARAYEKAEARVAQEALARAQDLAEVLTALEREQARLAALAEARARQEAAARARDDRRRPRAPLPVEDPPVATVPQPPPSLVNGRISIAFGQRGEAGPARGITFATASAARVVSPCQGRVVFAGPFRRFGQVVILECGPGLHAVLAGFDTLDTEAGAVLMPGEALGRLGTSPSGGSLYVELRRLGQMLDPEPWLAEPK